MRALSALPFADPFPRGHCAVLAFVCAAYGARATDADAIRLAKQAGRLGYLSWGGVSKHYFLHMTWWAEAVGLVVVRELRYTRTVSGRVWGGFPYRIAIKRRHRPTVARWLRTHRSGRWVVGTRAHVFAVVDGHVWGTARLRAIVTDAVELRQAREGRDLEAVAGP